MPPDTEATIWAQLAAAADPGLQAGPVTESAADRLAALVPQAATGDGHVDTTAAIIVLAENAKLPKLVEGL